MNTRQTTERVSQHHPTKATKKDEETSHRERRRRRRRRRNREQSFGCFDFTSNFRIEDYGTSSNSSTTSICISCPEESGHLWYASLSLFATLLLSFILPSPFLILCPCLSAFLLNSLLLSSPPSPFFPSMLHLTSHSRFRGQTSGSDVHYWAHGKCGPFKVDGPLILGHESAGIVTSVGEGVTHLKGDLYSLVLLLPYNFVILSHSLFCSSHSG